MNKLMIATDIHGSLYYARKVVDTFLASGADMLMLLGDTYYHGIRNALPQEYNPMAVCQLLDSVADRLIVVRGNCDSEVDSMVSSFPIVDSAVAMVGNTLVYGTHGHVYHKSNMPPMASGSVLVYGHYHVNEINFVNGSIAVNVGSASLPKDGYHSYCIIGHQSIMLCQLDTNKVICSQAINGGI